MKMKIETKKYELLLLVCQCTCILLMDTSKDAVHFLHFIAHFSKLNFDQSDTGLSKNILSTRNRTQGTIREIFHVS